MASVEKGGPAEKAGLELGDVIRKVDGRALISSGDLPALIGLAAPGDKIQLEVWRKGSTQRIEARLGNAAEKGEQVANKEEGTAHGRLGLGLRSLKPDELRQAGVENGMLIENVSGPAESAGVEQGDVLIAINGTAVKNVEQVRAAVAKSAKSVALLIQRGDEKIFVPVRLG